MRLHEAMKAARERRDYSQQSLAVLIGSTQGNMSKYELGDRTIPDDIALSAIRVLRDPRLLVAYEHEKQSNLINMPLLNNVDENAVVILDVLVEEAEELIASAQALKKLLRNKKSREDFSQSEWQQLVKCEEQIADLSPAMKLHFVVMAEQFDLDLERLSLSLKAKCKTKKYYL